MCTSDIKVNLSCLNGLINCRNYKIITAELEKEIRQNALKAWNEQMAKHSNGELTDGDVRFLQKISQNTFRFLKIKQKNDGSLVVYH